MCGACAKASRRRRLSLLLSEDIISYRALVCWLVTNSGWFREELDGWNTYEIEYLYRYTAGCWLFCLQHPWNIILSVTRQDKCVHCVKVHKSR